MQKTNTFKLITCIAIVVTVFVMLFSTFYIAGHADHHCTDDNCLVCEIMAQCASNLKTIGTAIILACASIFLFMSEQKHTSYVMPMVSGNSLISQKVRLND